MNQRDQAALFRVFVEHCKHGWEWRERRKPWRPPNRKAGGKPAPSPRDPSKEGAASTLPNAPAMAENKPLRPACHR